MQRSHACAQHGRQLATDQLPCMQLLGVARAISSLVSPPALQDQAWTCTMHAALGGAPTPCAALRCAVLHSSGSAAAQTAHSGPTAGTSCAATWPFLDWQWSSPHCCPNRCCPAPPSVMSPLSGFQAQTGVTDPTTPPHPVGLDLIHSARAGAPSRDPAQSQLRRPGRTPPAAGGTWRPCERAPAGHSGGPPPAGGRPRPHGL